MTTETQELIDLRRDIALLKVDQRVSANSSHYHIMRCRLLEKANEAANAIIGELSEELKRLHSQ